MKPKLKLGKHGSCPLGQLSLDLADMPLTLKRNAGGRYYWELRRDNVAYWWWTTLEGV